MPGEDAGTAVGRDEQGIEGFAPDVPFLSGVVENGARRLAGRIRQFASRGAARQARDGEAAGMRRDDGGGCEPGCEPRTVAGVWRPVEVEKTEGGSSMRS